MPTLGMPRASPNCYRARVGLEVDETAAAPARVAAGFVVGAQVAGRYRIVRTLGIGGMGEVFEVEDLVVGTRVALKALRADRTAPAMVERLRRELALARKITHRNVCRIHDLGDHEGRVFLTMELLEGETLSERLQRGRPDHEAALAIADQLVAGLAAAHAEGIVHRDFKSSNVMLVGEGRPRVVVTDFGLARSAVVGEHADLTGDAAMLGTAAYMAPEQVEGKPVTAAADVYALGVVLFEMMTGELPFRGDTPLATASLRLTSDPPSARSRRSDVPYPWDATIARCLARAPGDRFARVEDLVPALRQKPPASPATKRRRAIALGLVAAVGIAGGSAAIGYQLRDPTSPPTVAPAVPVPPASPSFTPVTFRRGSVGTAQFSNEGRGIVFTARWHGEKATVFLAIEGHPDARPLYPPGLALLRVSATRELALLDMEAEKLFRASLAGGEPRLVAENVLRADWIPGRDELAVIRRNGTRFVVEFPIGTPVFENDETIGHVRVSPDGTRVAVVASENSRHSVVVIDRKGSTRTLLNRWRDVSNQEWSPDGRELWLSGSPPTAGTVNAIHAVDLEGRLRTIYAAPVSLTLHDVGSDGRALLTRDLQTVRMIGHRAGDKIDRDLSWFDAPAPLALSANGELVLFLEQGEAAPKTGEDVLTFVRPTDGSPAVKLGIVGAMSLSPDGKLAIGQDSEVDPERLKIIPVAGGASRTLPLGPIWIYKDAAFFPDGRRIVFSGIERGSRRRLYVQDLDGGDPRPITPLDVVNDYDSDPVSPDGAWVFARDASRITKLFPVAGGSPREVPGLEPDDRVLRWSNDGMLLVQRRDAAAIIVDRVDPATGKRQPLLVIQPSNPGDQVGRAVLTADGQSYVYTSKATLSQLFVVDGLR